MEARTASNRPRLLLAAGLGAALCLGAALFVVLAGPGDPREFAQAPRECVVRWNEDPAALAFGRHQSGAHDYYEVQVLTLSPDGQGQLARDAPGASCAVVFASSALDPEPISAAQIVRRGFWTPLSRFADYDRLAELQGQAQSDYNARIGPNGAIAGL